MAKDPAILWYWGDWNSGTQLLTRFLKGCYMDLLHAQFNNGPLSLEEIKICLGSDFGQSWPALQKKFTQTETGLYFNERMEHEKENRIKFKKHQSESGSKGAAKRWGNRKKDSDPISDPINNPNSQNIAFENEDENEIPVLSDNGIFKIEDCLTIALADQRWVEATKTSAEELWDFNRYLESTGEYQKNPADYKKHFFHWRKKNPSSTKQPNGNIRPIKSINDYL